MIYITGDTHRSESDFQDILEFCELYETTKDDFMIITGDVGVNYFVDHSDEELKNWLEGFPITFLMVRGNHEERPENIPWYELTHLERDNFEGDVFIEEGYPSLLFADNGLLRIEDKSFYVINGAYSVDKYVRISWGAEWFEDEELFDWEMDIIREEIKGIDHVDVVLSHTCPKKYIPHEAKLPSFDQSTISHLMEEFLDEVEAGLNYDNWYCGHWHIDKQEGDMVFLYNEIMEVE